MTDSNRVKYVFVGKVAIIRCFNNSEDNITSRRVPLINSVWFRSLPDQTEPHQFDESQSERVRVFRHTLIFSPVLSSDEGEYYCCATAGGPCSKPLNVTIFGKCR